MSRDAAKLSDDRMLFVSCDDHQKETILRAWSYSSGYLTKIINDVSGPLFSTFFDPDDNDRQLVTRPSKE